MSISSRLASEVRYIVSTDSPFPSMSKMTINFEFGMKEIINHDMLRIEMQLMSVISFHLMK